MGQRTGLLLVVGLVGATMLQSAFSGPEPLPATSPNAAVAAVRSPGCKLIAPLAKRATVPRTTVAPPRTPVPYFARKAGRLPRDGAATVAGVALPPGSRCAGYWATDAGAPNAADLARRLAPAFARTGLWPVLWDFAEDPDHYALSSGDPRRADALEAGAVVRAIGAGFDRPPADRGLARGAVRGPVALDPFRVASTPGGLDVPAPVLLLVPVHRPADALSVLAFIQSEELSDPQATAIARSWEERFAAVLTTVGPGAARFAVGAPPTARDQARALADEQTAFASADSAPTGAELAQALRRGRPGPGVQRSKTLWSFGWPD